MSTKKEAYIPQHMEVHGEAVTASHDQETRELPIKRALAGHRSDSQEYVYRILPGESGIVES